MKRLRLEAICAGLAVGLAVSYGVLAHDFSALKDGSGNSVLAGAGGCVESSGSVIGGADCEKTTVSAAAPAAMADNAPAAMADKKEMMAENQDPMPTAAAGTAVAASTGTTASSVPNVKDGSGNAVRAGAGGCVESPGGSSGGCEPGAEPPANMAETPVAPAPMADRQKPIDDRKAMTASATGGTATSDTAMGVATLADGRTINGPVGTATPGHLRDGSGKAVRSGFGSCINLGYSVNSPDHPIECEFQPMQSVAVAPPHQSLPPEKPAPAPEAAPPVAAVTTPEPAPASAAREVPAAPPIVVPGTVRNTSPIGDGSDAAAMADAGATDTSDEFPAQSRRRSERGALVDDGPPQDSGAMAQPSAPPQSVPGTVRNTGPAGETAASEPAKADVSELKDSPPPPPVPAPPTQITRRDSDSMDIPPPVRSQDSGAGAAPSPPPTDVPGTVRSTAPSGETAAPSGQTAAPSGDVQMPPAKPAPIPAPEYEKITLSADVLFKFDRYREKDMLKAGRAKLDDVADQINNYIKDTVETITLTGHTDRLGSDAYNQRLSERRAKTVKNYLVKKGIDGGKIADSGRGEREPVMQCKGNKATKKLIRCLQPNRRVDVEIRGTKQK